MRMRSLVVGSGGSLPGLCICPFFSLSFLEFRLVDGELTLTNEGEVCCTEEKPEGTDLGPPVQFNDLNTWCSRAQDTPTATTTNPTSYHANNAIRQRTRRNNEQI